MSEWITIETAPNDGQTHIRGCWVRVSHHPAGTVSYYWQSDVGHINDDGAFIGNGGDDFGFDPDDYTHWMPEPEPATQPPKP